MDETENYLFCVANVAAPEVQSVILDEIAVAPTLQNAALLFARTTAVLLASKGLILHSSELRDDFLVQGLVRGSDNFCKICRIRFCLCHTNNTKLLLQSWHCGNPTWLPLRLGIHIVRNGTWSCNLFPRKSCIAITIQSHGSI